MVKKRKDQMYRTVKTFIEPTRSSYCLDLLCTFFEIEVWRQVRDYPNNDVSNMGNIRHFRKGSSKNHMRQSGYVCASVLAADDIKYDRKGSPISDVILIHKLVATTFIPKTEYMDSMTIDHLNQKRDDNRLINLRFATKKEQRANQSYPTNNSTSKAIWKCDIDNNKLEHFKSIKCAGMSLMNSAPHISATNTEFLEILNTNGKIIRSRTPSAYHYFYMDKLSGKPIPPIHTGPPCRENGTFIKSETLTRSDLKRQWDDLNILEKEHFENMAINARNVDLSLPLDKEGQINYGGICASISNAMRQVASESQTRRSTGVVFGYKWVYDEIHDEEVSNEVWVIVPSKVLYNPSNEYEVSTLGRIRKKKNKQIITGSTCQGYRVYTFRQRVEDGNRIPAKTVKGHRIVAITFLTNPENKPIVDHINGNKQDNTVKNLRWVTSKENKDAHENLKNRAWTLEQEKALLESVEHTPRTPNGKIKWSLYTKPEILKNRTKSHIQGRLRHFVSMKNRDTNISNHKNNHVHKSS